MIKSRDIDAATTEKRLQRMAILRCEIEDLEIAKANKFQLLKFLENTLPFEQACDVEHK